MSEQMIEAGEQNAKLRPRVDAVPEGLAGARWYLSNFEAFEKSLNGEALSGIHAVRKQAIARFAELGFPTTHDEEWKYTDVSSLAKVPFQLSPGNTPQRLTAGEIEPFQYRNLTPNTMVWVNGHFSRQLSTISGATLRQPGLRLESLAETLGNDPELLMQHLSKYARYDDNAFTALSTAFFQDGAFLSFPDGFILEHPVHLLFVSTKLSGPVAVHPRNLILVGKNSQVSILESHRSLTEGVCFTNAVTEILLGENSVLEYHQLQDERDHSFHVGTTHVRQQRSSSFTSHTISLGGALVRNNLVGVLEGEGAECTMNGLYVATGRQHIDNHTEIDHATAHCNSHELYKGILAGRSKGVFNGKIRVRKDAQKTDAKQT
ncbi:MAG: Fe-S cluster assembly protein SufD, partial [Ignavibacteria bacterium]